jgi:lactoylglutathione lyase
LAPAAVTGHVTAVGIGVSNLNAAKKFYGMLGYRTCIRMNFAPWSEDVCMGSGIALVPMSWKVTKDAPERSVKNLPVKMTFTAPNPVSLQDRLVKGGGSIVTNINATVTEAKAGAVYVKDPDGYLLEIIPGGSVTMTGVAYGSSNLKKSASFFASLFGTSPSQQQKLGAWDMISVPTKKAFTVQFLDFRDGRPTKNLPLKIVIGAPNIDGFKQSITNGGGTIPQSGASALGGRAAFGKDPVDQILIEINKASGGRGKG